MNSRPPRKGRPRRVMDAAEAGMAARAIAEWLELPVPVTVRPSGRAKAILLRLIPERGLEVVAPAGCDPALLPMAVRERRPWIEQAVVKLMAEGGLPGAMIVPRPERLVLTAFGAEWRLLYLSKDGGASGCRVTAKGPGELLVSGAVGNGAAVAGALAATSRKLAAPLLIASLRQVSRQAGLPFAGAAVRAQRSRWGSCTTSRRISLNYTLAFLPWALARYVFLHELCHTLEMNHSKRYWEALTRHEPDCRRLDAGLARAREYLPLWLRYGVTGDDIA